MATLAKPFIVAASVVFTINTGSAGQQIDQQYVPAMINGYGIIGPALIVDSAQTFTVGIDGLLTGFDIWVTRQENVQQPLLFDIRRTAAGAPIGANSGPDILANGALPADTFAVSRPFDPPSSEQNGAAVIDLYSPHLAPEALVHVDLHPYEIPVMRGQVLAIVLRCDDPNDFRGVTYAWHGKGPGEYAGGAEYARSTADNTWYTLDVVESLSFDYAFRTYVESLPEPATLSLLGLAAVTVGFVRRRRRLVDYG